MTSPTPHFPPEIAAAQRRAKRLAWWSIVFLSSIVLVMGLAMGSSQAMRTAWTEDLLSLLPPISFLIATRLEKRGPSRYFPYGFDRAHSLAFFASATALAAMGGFLLYDAAATLVMQEHPTISSVEIFGREVWLGWIMIAALIYSIIPPVILGRMKLKCAEALNDEVLHTDAKMNAADWKTGAAGVVGIVGVAFGFWWADAAAAGFIAFDILRDGLKSFRLSVAELMDGAPRKVGSTELDPLVERIAKNLRARFGNVNVQMRETGRHIRVTVGPSHEPDLPIELAEEIAGKDEAWRLVEVTVAQRSRWPAEEAAERA